MIAASATAAVAIAPARFIKLDDAGAELAADALEWSQVLDTTTALIWAAEELPKRYTWKQAIAATAKLALGGHVWRLPTRIELLSLVDDTRYSPAIDVAFFPKCASDWYWTSTRVAWSPGDCAWFVGFYYGFCGSDYQSDHYHVRACRPRQNSVLSAPDAT